MLHRAVAFVVIFFFGALVACRCNTSVPSPKTVTVVVGDATIPIAQQVCTNMIAFCPASVPDGGEPICEAVINARYGLTPATMPTILVCEAQSADKTTFFNCGGVSACP